MNLLICFCGSLGWFNDSFWFWHVEIEWRVKKIELDLGLERSQPRYVRSLSVQVVLLHFGDTLQNLGLCTSYNRRWHTTVSVMCR